MVKVEPPEVNVFTIAEVVRADEGTRVPVTALVSSSLSLEVFLVSVS